MIVITGLGGSGTRLYGQIIKDIGINKILINTFYLKEHFSNFIKNKNFNLDIHIVEDGESILDTGGGILNMINKYEIQFFLTGTDKELFSFVSTNSQFYNINET